MPSCPLQGASGVDNTSARIIPLHLGVLAASMRSWLRYAWMGTPICPLSLSLFLLLSLPVMVHTYSVENCEDHRDGY